MTRFEPLDPDRLADLRTEAAELADQLGAGQDPDDRHTGTDDERVVEVSVDGDGRACQVHVDRRWRELVGSAGLGPAVVAAVNIAMAARMTRWLGAVDEAATRPTHPGVSTDPGKFSGGSQPGRHNDPLRDVGLSPGQPGDPGSAESTGHIRDIFALLDSFEAQLTGLNDALARSMAEEIVGEGGQGSVRATIRGGALAEVRFDPQWLAAAGPDRIAEATRDALRAAHDRTSRRAAESIAAFPAIGEVRSLADRPDELLRRLGLQD